MRTPAGWYPQQDGRQRYWDGQQWTEHFAPGQGGSATAATVPAAKRKRAWYTKKRVIIPADVLVFAFAINAITPDDGTAPVSAVSSSTTSSSPKSSASPSSASKSTDPAAAKAAAEAKAKAAAAAKAKAAADAKVKAAAAAKARAAEAAKRSPKAYKAIGSRAYAKLVKNPDAHIGEKYVVYGVVTQFDSATGQDTFRADTAAARQSDWYDYDVNTLIQTDNAKLFSDVVEDDLVTLYVEVAGSFSYDTQIGGSTTVPLLKANIVKVTGSAK